MLCMKRKKRDKLERAFSNGFQAGVTGRTQDICPYTGIYARSSWLGGWRKGVDERSYYCEFRH